MKREGFPLIRIVYVYVLRHPRDRHCHGLWPLFFVAIIAVAVVVCGRRCIGSICIAITQLTDEKVSPCRHEAELRNRNVLRLCGSLRATVCF